MSVSPLIADGFGSWGGTAFLPTGGLYVHQAMEGPFCWCFGQVIVPGHNKATTSESNGSVPRLLGQVIVSGNCDC